MARFTLYLEEDNQDRDLDAALRRLGLSVHRCAAVGMNGKTDREQLHFAAESGFVLYTSNVRDFARLHREYLAIGRAHAGIIIRNARQWSIGEQSRRIHRLWETISQESMVNRIESISQWGEDRKA